MAIKIAFDLIRDKRVELKLSQQELSDKSGVNISTIKSLETGRMNTTKANIQLIADVLALDINVVYNDDFRETKVITIINNKGGVGKTSGVSSLGYALSEIDTNRILLIDGCMQMNLSYTYGFARDENNSLDNALRKEESLLGYIKKTNFTNIDIIISDLTMATMEMALFTKTMRESIFKRILTPVVEKGIYDYILIDTNPTLGMLNINILNASDFVIIPVEMTAFGVLGLEIINNFVKTVKSFNEKLKLAGILRTKVDIREGVTHEADKLLNELVGDKILETSISIDTNIKKGQWDSDPLYIFKVKTRVAEQYRALAKEVIKIVR